MAAGFAFSSASALAVENAYNVANSRERTKKAAVTPHSFSAYAFQSAAAEIELRALNLESSKGLKGKIKQVIPLIKTTLLIGLPLASLIIISYFDVSLADSRAGEKEHLMVDLERMDIMFGTMEALKNERGATCLYVSAADDVEVSRMSGTLLGKFRAETDYYLLTSGMETWLPSIEILRNRLEKHRKNLGENCTKNFRFYDLQIDSLLAKIYEMSRNCTEGHFWIDLMVRNVFWQARNYHAKKQAVGSLLYSIGTADPELQQEFSMISNVAHRLFKTSQQAVPEGEPYVEVLFEKNRQLLDRLKIEEKQLLLGDFRANSSLAVGWFKNYSKYLEILEHLNDWGTAHLKYELGEQIYNLRTRHKTLKLSVMAVVAFCVILSIIHIVRQYFLMERIREFTAKMAAMNKEVAHEKKKTEKLLAQMLPRTVAEKLLKAEHVQPDSYDEVTIFFSDIKGFTNICSRSSPFEVILLLNELYQRMDEILDGYDCYKVETIGDSYMVVSGLPESNAKRHSNEICTLALIIVMEMEDFSIPHIPHENLHMRVGIHTVLQRILGVSSTTSDKPLEREPDQIILSDNFWTTPSMDPSILHCLFCQCILGPCAAGVVGVKMPRYCLFGDTVNIASRMESNGSADRIQMSSMTKAHLAINHRQFEYIERGLLPVKGKGHMLTYWLIGKEGFPFRINIPENEVFGDISSVYKGDLHSPLSPAVDSAMFSSAEMSRKRGFTPAR